jgi:hypothetical protein
VWFDGHQFKFEIGIHQIPGAEHLAFNQDALDPANTDAAEQKLVHVRLGGGIWAGVRDGFCRHDCGDCWRG